MYNLDVVCMLEGNILTGFRFNAFNGFPILRRDKLFNVQFNVHSVVLLAVIASGISMLGSYED